MSLGTFSRPIKRPLSNLTLSQKGSFSQPADAPSRLSAFCITQS